MSILFVISSFTMFKKLIFVLSLAVVFGGGIYHVSAEEQVLPVPVGAPTTVPKPVPAIAPSATPLPTTQAEEIKKIQGFLINQKALKIDGEPTGTTGPKTREAIKKLQRALKLQETGTVGPKTKSKIKEILSTQKNSPDARALEKKTETDAQPEKVIIKTDKDTAFVLPNPRIPRILIVKGKGILHMNVEKGTWEIDEATKVPSELADFDKLSYCKTFYPKTTKVGPYMYESLDAGRTASTTKPPTMTGMTYRCVVEGEKTIPVDPDEATDATSGPRHLPRVIFSTDKPSLHINQETGAWVKDPAGVNTTASSDKLAYCKTFYPSTISVMPFGYEKGPDLSLARLSYRCVLEGESETELPRGSVLGISTSAEQLKTKTKKVLNYKFTKPISPNAKGTDVINLQTLLRDNCYIEGVTGDTMDGPTVEALKNFQAANKIPTTGTFGPQTRAKATEIASMPAICVDSSTPQIVLRSPNGGEVYSGGQQITVLWNSKKISASSPTWVALAVYDANNVLLGNKVITSNSSVNDGQETITLPTLASIQQSNPAVFQNATFGNHFKIIVNSTTNNLPYQDYSDNFFTINTTTSGCTGTTPSVTMMSPNGGETYQAGQQITAKWKTCNLPYNPATQLAVMDDRIPNWQTLSLFGSVPALNFATLVSSSGNEYVYQYSFVAPSSFNSSLPAQYQNVYGGLHYKIVANVALNFGTPGQQIYEDLSDNLFTINGLSGCNPNSLPTVTTQTTTEISATGAVLNGRWTSGGCETITWFQYGITTSLGISTAPAGMQSAQALGGVYNIQVPTFTPNTVYYHRICASNALGQTCGLTLSFTTPPVQTGCIATTPPSITVTSPNGGEVYTAGQQINVTWTSCNIPANALINMTINGAYGLTAAANNGNVFVNLPTIAQWPMLLYGLHHKIYMEWNGNTSVNDQSNNLFTINGPNLSHQLVLTGGVDANGNMTSDFYSSTNGVSWNLVSQNNPWGFATYKRMFSFQGKAYIYDSSVPSHLWSSSDGQNWSAVTFPGQAYASAVSVYNGKIYILGGYFAQTTATPTNEVWTYDGTNWVQLPPPPWSTRGYANSIVYNNKLYMIYGEGNAMNPNDIWSYDGTSWTSQGTIPWMQNKAKASYSVFNDGTGEKIYVLGGFESVIGTNNLNEVWTFDGANWVRKPDANWGTGDSGASYVLNGKLYYAGGRSLNGTPGNSIWSTTNGSTWALETNSPGWSPRAYFAAMLVP